jgi:hypothetical protein
VGIVGIAALVTREGIEGRFGDGFPRRGWTVLSVTLAVLLTFMWLGRIMAALDGDLVTAGLTSETTLTIQALDLGLVVPALLLSAAIAWHRSQVGYAFVAALSVTLVGMAGAIVAMLLSAAVVEDTLEVAPIAIFGIAGAAGLIIAIRAYHAVVRSPVTPSGATTQVAVPAG